MPQLYLASGSLQRLQFMQDLQLQFEVIPPCIDEHKKSSENPSEYVCRLALEKSGHVAKILQTEADNAIVVGADTCVAVDDVVLGKPKDRQEALQMIRMLSGRTHEVHTAVAVAYREQQQCKLRSSRIRFAKLSDSQIFSYLDTGEYEGRAGSYAIQGAAADLIDHLEGSYSCVVGMPIDYTIDLLRECGVSVPDYNQLQYSFTNVVKSTNWSGNFFY